MNWPGRHVSAPALTEKDREDVVHAVQHGWITALSFVRRAEDLARVATARPSHGQAGRQERKGRGVANLRGSWRRADAVMVARGDLGVSCRSSGCRSCRSGSSRRPTSGASLSYCDADARIDGASPPPDARGSLRRRQRDSGRHRCRDALGRDGVGEYPFEAVRAMDRIIREMEREGPARDERRRRTAGETVSAEDAIALGTSAAARMLTTPLTVTLTKGGFTARKVAALRPPVPVLAVTTEAATFRQLALVWGVMPVWVSQVPGYDAMLTVVRD